MAISDKEQSDKEQSAGGRTFEEFYVEDQVLLTGPEVEGKDVIGRIVSEVLDEYGVQLVPAQDEETDLWRMRWEPGEGEFRECVDKNLPTIPRECLNVPLGMRLYKIIRQQPSIPERGQVEVVVKFINDRGAGLCVRADPNWLTGYPYSAAGSPYSAAGSPYSAAGSALTEQGNPVGPTEFWNQWALEKIGLISNGSRNTQCIGHGVRVGVFDTSPFAEEGRPEPASDGHPPQLTVVHPKVFEQYPLPPLPPPETKPGEDPPDPPDLSSHGLSVAGLVYAVAPRSDIYLYRVLDQHARGNLFVLCYALREFMNDFLSAQGKLNGGIINLSLGVPLPEGWQNEVGAQDVFALAIALARAHCHGLTVVAAAGNRSAGLPAAAPPEFPASQPYVIGVMASNYQDDRSCFSNEGDVAAPGGDGYDCGSECEPTSEYDTCQCPWGIEEIERWKYGLIGPVLDTNGQFPGGFARWIGTSFATPLVSGLAALVLDEGGGAPTPQIVWSAIRDNARAAAGTLPPKDIVDVPATLQNVP